MSTRMVAWAARRREPKQALYAARQYHAAMIRLALVAGCAALASLASACSAPGGRGSEAPATAASAPGPAADPVSFGCPVRGAFVPPTHFFSQFYEDYILSYVFRDTPKGIYVDVGAYDPDAASVTKYFYRKGWRGVNIEPNPDHLAAMKRGRPEDVNLGVGISDAPAMLTFFKFEPRASGLSTFDPEIAARHRKSGYTYEELSIPVVTLDEALARSGMVKGSFEFLNVDVEGFERKVLSGFDVSRYPAKVIILEATAPLSEEPTQHKWEDLLFGRGYSFAMDDGLNRYYVHRAAGDLQARFLEVAYCVARDKRAKGVKIDGFMPEPVQ
jgi:FkbM family methyltransferase